MAKYTTHYLKLTGYGLSVPTGATITGIVVKVNRKVNGNGPSTNTTDNSIKLIKGGVISGTDHADTSTIWPNNSGVLTAVSYGSSSDLWGLTLTPADVNATDFGVAISAKGITGGANGSAAIDYATIDVFYTGTPTVTTSAVTDNNAPTTATGNGNVTSGGASTVTQRGVVINTTGTPTTSDTKFITTGTTGAFSVAMTNLTPGQLYYLRAFATNSYGTSYGSEVTFTTFEAVEKTYLYKVYRNGVYLGLLPSVTSEFSIAQDINSGSVELDITCGVSADRSSETLEALEDEDTGAALLDEDGEEILEEQRPEWLGAFDSGALIANDNQVKVYEYSTENPLGLLVFDGWITTNSAIYGSTGNIKIICLSKGSDLVDCILQGSPYVSDQSQTQGVEDPGGGHTASISTTTGKLDSSQSVGQTFTVGAGVTNIGAIDLKLNGTDTSMTLTLWPNVSSANAGTGALGTVTRSVSASGTVVRFAFATPITVTPGTQYFFTLQDNSGGSVNAYYKNSDVYAGGDMYYENYGGAGGDTNWHLTPYSNINVLSDLYFVTYSNGGATTAVFSSQDPTAILKSIIDNYVSSGGSVNYSSSTDDTGLSLSYTFISNTVLEGVQKCLELAPSDWYWYVDPGSLIIYFKQTLTTATHKFVLGQHLSSIEVSRTVDNLVNKVLFSGGDTGAGSNLLSVYANTTSITSHGRQRLARLSDGRVTVQATADKLSNNELDYDGSEVYQTPLIIPYSTYDISSIKVGDTVGFGGFGNIVDNLILQVARTVYHPNYIELTLGRIPPRQSQITAQTIAEINALQTLNNPTTPS